MPQKRRSPARRIDPAALAEFQAGIRKRYSDEEILGQLRASAETAKVPVIAFSARGDLQTRLDAFVGRVMQDAA